VILKLSFLLEAPGGAFKLTTVRATPEAVSIGMGRQPGNSVFLELLDNFNMSHT
jgi:hypothetical protein